MLFNFSLDGQQILLSSYSFPGYAALIVLLPCHFCLILQIRRNNRAFLCCRRENAESFGGRRIDGSGPCGAHRTQSEDKNAFHSHLAQLCGFTG